MPLNQSALDEACLQGCQDPKCQHKDHTTLFLGQHCHPGAGAHVSYTLLSGVLTIYCAECGEMVTEIEVRQ